jgi:non-homologous end joining protein Ku
VDLIQEIAWNNTPQIKKKVIGNNYLLEIRKLIEQKRKARRTWQKNRSPEKKTILNNLTQQLTREIRKIKNESVNKYLQELTAESETDYSLWRYLNI